MKNIFNVIAAAAVCLFVASCAKERTAATNEANKRYFDSWVEVNKKSGELAGKLWEKTANGLYILENDEGTGDEITDSAFVYVHFTYTDLNGNIESTSRADVTQSANLGYNSSYYYGPVAWSNSDNGVTVGVKDMLSGMKIGGHRKAVIPMWLNTTVRYSSEDEFLAHVTEGSNRIYDVTVVEATNDILQYQIDSIETYWARHIGWDTNPNPGSYNNSSRVNTDINDIVFKEHWDTTYTGFYFRQYFNNMETDEDGNPSGKFDGDTTFLINYTGRLLNGQVFDTSIADTAKYYNIYSSSRTYSPVEVAWSTDTTAITFGDSEDMINGFLSMLSRIRNEEPGEEEAYTPGESIVAIFYSPLGYGYSAQGSSIPAYAPLRFDITLVKEEE